MKYNIERIGRTVILDDELVEKFLETGEELKQNIFTIRIKSHYGNDYGIDKVSDKELSNFCNEALFYEIQMYAKWPNICEWLNKNKENFISMGSRCLI